MDWHTYIRSNARLRNPGDHRCGHPRRDTRPCQFPVPYDDVRCPVHYEATSQPATVVDLSAYRRARAHRTAPRRAHQAAR